jgi:CBS domain-containing protein
MTIASILAQKGREVRTIAPDSPVSEAVRRMREERIGALVVSSDGARIAGILSDRGILWAIAERGVGVLQERIDTIMTREVHTCSAEDRVSAIMAAMTQRRIRHFPVVESGRLCGIISIGDVVKHRLDEMHREAEAMREYISGTR